MSETTASGEQAGEQQTELKRAIGPKLLLFFVIGDILGTGIYALTGNVAGVIGGALWVPFLGAFVVAFLTAFSYLELVGKYPRAAGAALYTNRAFRIPFLTFIVAFAVMSSGITSASSAAVAFGKTYLREFVALPTWAVGITFIVLLGLINFRGVGESLKANLVLTLIELSGLVIIIVIGVYAVATGEGEPSRLTEINTSESGVLLAITSATALAFFAMVGFEDSVNMAEEVQRPARIFPRSMLLGMGIAGLIYVLVTVTSSLLVPADRLAELYFVNRLFVGKVEFDPARLYRE